MVKKIEKDSVEYTISQIQSTEEYMKSDIIEIKQCLKDIPNQIERMENRINNRIDESLNELKTFRIELNQNQLDINKLKTFKETTEIDIATKKENIRSIVKWFSTILGGLILTSLLIFFGLQK